jgi:putative transposase
LLAQAKEANIAGLVFVCSAKRTADGWQRLVRDGHLPERVIMNRIAPVKVRVRGEAADLKVFRPISLAGA